MNIYSKQNVSLADKEPLTLVHYKHFEVCQDYILFSRIIFNFIAIFLQ